MDVRSSILVRLLRPSAAGSVTLNGNRVHVRTRAGVVEAPVDLGIRIAERRGLLGSRLEIRLGDDAPPVGLRLAGLDRGQAAALRAAVLELQVAGPGRRALQQILKLLDADRYVSRTAWDRWASGHARLLDCVPADVDALPLAPELRATIDKLRTLVADADRLRQVRNRRYVQPELERRRAWFDALENYPLTVRQREAAVCCDDAVLVVAGAGTGKTSTIVAKAAYVLDKGLARPDEVLLLAFGRKASDEMRERVARICPQPPAVRTFHALASSCAGFVLNPLPAASHRGTIGYPFMRVRHSDIRTERTLGPPHGVNFSPVPNRQAEAPDDVCQ